jgi:hypothetical protein
VLKSGENRSDDETIGEPEQHRTAEERCFWPSREVLQNWVAARALRINLVTEAADLALRINLVTEAADLALRINLVTEAADLALCLEDDRTARLALGQISGTVFGVPVSHKQPLLQG